MGQAQVMSRVVVIVLVGQCQRGTDLLVGVAVWGCKCMGAQHGMGRTRESGRLA
jgi:hypothetical protein